MFEEDAGLVPSRDLVIIEHRAPRHMRDQRGELKTERVDQSCWQAQFDS